MLRQLTSSLMSSSRSCSWVTSHLLIHSSGIPKIPARRWMHFFQFSELFVKTPSTWLVDYTYCLRNIPLLPRIAPELGVGAFLSCGACFLLTWMTTPPWAISSIFIVHKISERHPPGVLWRDQEWWKHLGYCELHSCTDVVYSVSPSIGSINFVRVSSWNFTQVVGIPKLETYHFWYRPSGKANKYIPSLQRLD